MTFTTGDIRRWVDSCLKDTPMQVEKKKELLRFWTEFYSQINTSDRENINEPRNKTQSVQYKEHVFKIVHDAKATVQTCDQLKELQLEIENQSMFFDEESIYKTAPNIIRMLIREKSENARDYLYARLLSKENQEMLSEFGQYTIEAIIVYVLGKVFNALSLDGMIRTSTLMEHLESTVRTQALIIKRRRSPNPITKEDAPMSEKKYKGYCLVVCKIEWIKIDCEFGTSATR